MADEAGGTPTAAPEKICIYPDCRERPWPDSPEGHCLYHWEGNGRDPETARLVWQEARRRGGDPKACDCRGWHFPPDPDDEGFRGATFQDAAGFFDATFLGLALFSDATFQDHAWFEGATFQGVAEFQDATFQGEALFMGATFGAKVLFGDATFQGVAEFQNATFQGEALFMGATFEGDAGFIGATFQGEAWFGGATFQDCTWFQGATFLADAWFGGAMVKPGVYVAFDLPSPLLSCRKPRPFRYREQGETAYRLAKQAAQDRGDYRRAGDYHYAEQCAIECGRRRSAGHWPWQKRFWGRNCWLLRLPELVLARGLFGYGEKPLRALVAGVVVVLLCSLVYCGWDGIMPSGSGDLAYQPGFWESGYFSLVTFTTLGYGDFHPKPGWPRAVAAIEAAAGAALMALFIVGLARKYTR